MDANGQQQRLLPVIRQLADEGIVISAETYDFEVAKACLAAGAKVLNLTGTAKSEAMYRLAAEHDAAVIVCYVAVENVREVSEIPIDHDPIPRMSEFFERDELAEGVNDQGFVDPGLGFYYDNLRTMEVRSAPNENLSERLPPAKTAAGLQRAAGTPPSSVLGTKSAVPSRFSALTRQGKQTSSAPTRCQK